MHNGEKPNKCNQCDFASTEAGNFNTPLKAHSRKKSKKCNECDFAFSQAGNLRIHVIMNPQIACRSECKVTLVAFL